MHRNVSRLSAHLLPAGKSLYTFAIGGQAGTAGMAPRDDAGHLVSSDRETIDHWLRVGFLDSVAATATG